MTEADDLIKAHEQVDEQTKQADDLHEALADLCHRQWSGWMTFLFSKCTRINGGGRYIPVEFVERWQRQIDTDYAGLSEDERDSDRKEADKFIDLIIATVSREVNAEMVSSREGLYFAEKVMREAEIIAREIANEQQT